MPADEESEVPAEEEGLAGSLIVTARLCRSLRAQMLQKTGLHAGQDTLLRSLRDKDGQTMSSLAANLDVRPPTVTKMVARLGAQGHLRRECSARDSRQNLVFLTESGWQLLGQVDEIWLKAEKAAFDGFKEKDSKRLRKILARIRSNLEKYPKE